MLIGRYSFNKRNANAGPTIFAGEASGGGNAPALASNVRFGQSSAAAIVGAAVDRVPHFDQLHGHFPLAHQ